jgi:hypothetical protein
VVPDVGYMLGEDNRWGWITLYVVTIVVAVLGNLLFIISSLCTRSALKSLRLVIIKVVPVCTRA